MPNNIERLYQNLKADGYNLGSMEQFAKNMSDSTKADKLYQNLTADGYKLGSRDEFFGKLRPEQPTAVTEPQPTAQPQVVPQPTPHPAAKQPTKDPLTGKPLSHYLTGEGAHQAFIGTPDFEASYEVGNGKRRKVSEDIQEARHNTKVTPGVQQYVDENGNVVKENVITPIEPQEVAYDRYLRESRNSPTLEQQNQQRLDEVNKKLAKSQERELRELAKMYDQSPSLFLANAINMAASPYAGVNMMMANNETENRKLLEARQHLLSEGKRIIDEVKIENREGDVDILGGLKQAARNVANSTFKKSTWDFGATDINTQTKLMEAIIRMDNGEQITEDERELLSDWALNNAVSSQYGKQLSGWAKAGQVTGESLPFMLEMAINPASGLGQSAQKGLVKYAMQKYGKKWVKDHAKGVLASKIATRVAGDVLGGQIMAATTGLVRTSADAAKRYSEGMVENVDQQGNIIFKDKEKRISPMEAFTKAWVANGIGNSSEMWGEYLAPVTGILRNAIGKAVIGKAGREALNLTGRLGDVSLNKAQRFIFDVTSQRGLGAISQGLDNFLKKTQWHGVFSEYIEEELGNLANAATVGDMTFDNAEDTGIFNLQQHIDTFAGVALMGGFISALHTKAYAWDKWNNRMSKIDEKGNKFFADWDDMKTVIQSVADDPIALNSTITAYINNANMSQDERKVVLDYAGKVLERKGAVMAEYQPRMNSSSIKKNDDGSFSVASLDAFGNVIGQQSFETEDEAKAYQGELKMRQQSQDMKDYLQLSVGMSYPESSDLVAEFLGEDPTPEQLADIQNPETEIGRQFQERKNQRVIEKARATREAIAAFEEENGWEAGTIRELSEADPMQLSQEELQMADQAREFLKGLAYPNTEVHTEVSAQEGAEAAEGVVNQVTSTEDAIDPQNNAGKEITEGWAAAQAARQQLFSRNEDLMQEVERMEQQGFFPQEIVSSLDSFSPQDRQTVIDYYNAQAKFNAYMAEAQRKIAEAANMGRQRRTFKGTINGNPDTSNIVNITDGTNTYVLVSGNVQTSNDGRITGSDSGLIIAFDEAAGEMVQLSDASGYSVIPSGVTLDAWEAQEVERLGQGVTMVSDPNGTLSQPQSAPGKPGLSPEESGTLPGGNAPSATAPATPTPPAANATGTVADTSGNTAGTPAVSIESVIDKDGIKRYENGVSVDDAIADIQNDGFDVGEVADASIAEAQQTIDKINGKATKTRKDLIDRKKAQGVIDYYQALKERAAMLSQGTEEAPANGEENVNNQTGQHESGKNVVPSQPGQTVEEQKQERIKALKAELGELFDDDFTKANDVYELVSMWIGRKRNLAWDDVNGKRGLQKELGWTRMIGGDTKYIETLLAKKGEGIGVDEFVHMVWESPENSVGEEKRWTTEEIKEALLDLLKSAQSKSDVVDYAVNSREQAARVAPEAQQQMEQEAAAQQPAEVEVAPLTDEEIAQMEANLPFAAPVEGEDIPDSPITQLMKLVQELMQQEGMPQIKLVDTDRMSDDEWIDLTSQVYGGDFVDEETVNEVRDYALTTGVIRDDDGTILVFSDSQTPEDVKSKIQTILDYANTLQEEGRNDGRDTIVERTETKTPQEQKPETPAAAGAAGTESQGSTEPVVTETPAEVPQGTERDEYLQPRNEKEEQIIADVIAQLQQEIDAAIKERDKAASDLQKAQAKESDRATDMFSDDEAFQEPGQLFSFDDMGGTDRTKEGVNRRTAAERKALQDAQKKLDQLQSEAERKSRIRGALDNERRQTSFTPAADATGTVTGQPQSREEYLASHPLTEEQIMADMGALEDEKLNAIDFLRGEDDSAISRFYYDSIYERAQKTSSENRQKKEGNEPAKEKKEERDSWQSATDEEFYPVAKDWLDQQEKPYSSALQRKFKIGYHKATRIMERYMAEKGAENDPMAAIEQAAQSFREEQKSQDQKDIDDALKEFNDFLDNAKGSNVLDKFMRKGLEGNDKAQASLLDAFTLTNEAQRMFLKDLLRLASKVGYAYIKSGVHDVQTWSKKMSDSIGQKLKEVLGWEDDIIGEFVDEVWQQKYTVDGQRMRLSEHAERLKNGNSTDQTVNEHKDENNDPENVVSSQQKPASKLEGDSAEFAERQHKLTQLTKKIRAKLQGIVNWGDQPKPLSAYKQIAKELGIENLSDTDLQELIETEVVNLAREIANKEGLTDEKKFLKIVKLYEGQPSLNARDNDRINKQQYSTPAPMAFLMGKFLKEGKEVKSGLEPSAGNGMLTLNLPKEAMHVNDIDEMRLSNLAKQGFAEVTSQDGTQPFGEKKYDVVVTNPPFGNVPAKTYDGLYEISGLEHQMAINALESMKDDGRAAIIIGGNTEYNQNGSIKGKDRAFFNYLYAHYNVVDVINMDGKTLYSRQGTGFPVRMILINGRKEFNPRSFAPTIQKARAERVNSYDELYKRVNDDILSDSNKPASVHDTESGESDGKHDNGHAGNTTQTGVRNVRSEGGSKQRQLLDSGGQSVSGGVGSTSKGADTGTDTSVGERGDVVHGTGSTASQPGGSTPSSAEQGGNVPNRRNDTERPDGRVDVSVGGGSRPSVEVRRLGTEKVPYRQQSKNPYSLQSQMPAEQAEVVKKALEELGDVDEFLVKELGYSSVEDLHHGSQSPEKHGGLAAEQIDSVAMAIHQMNEGNAFIIGDQTGIGKGRQAAALIRYGVKKGGCPVFITVKKGLFSDMYRDLCDIGSPGLRPFIWSADDEEHSADVTDKNGNVVYKRPSDKEQKRVVDYINKYGKLPPEYDYIVTTYDSFKGGTMVYEEGQKKARNFGKKSPTTGAYNSQAKRDALERLAENSYVIMDESHNAGGETSAVSGYLQYITTKAKGVTFLSATFAKRPGNMPIYSLKTAIAKAGVKIGELIDAVKQGGATFQEIMSKALTEAGQMIRRERDMTGVTIDWKGIEDEAVIEKQRQQYDTIIGLFNDIIDFQRRYVDPIVNKKNDEAADEQGEVDHTPGTRDMGINNTPFASRTYNMVQQVLLSLKAEETAKRAIEHLKQGHKPVIALANTNEGAADEVSTGEDMEMPDLSVNLKKGLQGTLRITKKDAFGNSTNEMIPFDELSEAGQARYREIMDAIENASSGLSLSPIDVIKNELKKAGYKVGELTGRKQEFVYNEDGTVKRVKRQDSDKKRTAADFNNGKLDVLILNKSAGTGISLHASSKFDDQRQRVMIVAQAQGDVNDEVQIRGRIDRTGQVLRGMYEYVVSQIPSEQRLLMMLKAKLRSLDANTTSSQKSKFNEMQVQDIINKYGDDIVIQYLAEHTDLAAKMVDPLKWGEGFETMPAETLIANATKDGEAGKTASKVLGRMALLKVAEQEKMLAEIGDLYQAEIDRLNEMGENDLEITEMPLRAKTLGKKVWEEGVEPGGKNPFADNSYVEEVEMDILKKPMKAEELKKSQSRLLGGKTWDEYKQGVLERLDKWEAEKKKDATDTITARAEKKAQAEKEKYIKGAKKAQEKNGMTDAEIEKNGQYQYDHFYKEEMEKLQAALDAVDKQKQAFVDALETFTTDGVYALPTDIYDLGELSFEPSFGKVIDIKISDNFSTAASTISFATLDGRRKITIPISGMVKQSNGEKRDIKPIIVQQSAQSRSGFFGSNIANMMKVLEQNVDNWDKLTSTATRKKGYIITGNLLKALTSLQKQRQGGKLISYTTDTGEIRQGVLMGERFDPGALTSQNPISSAKADLDDWGKDRKITSADGDVTIKADGYGSWMSYTLKVPKSKKKGEKYFNDKVLLSLMDGQFEGSSALKADFKEENLDKVLKRLDELGVTVQSKKEDTNNDIDSGYSEDIEEDELNTLEGGYSEETDEEVIERLEREPKIKVYRAMSLIDGKLYPPMATKQDGQLREPIELGKWEKSDEHPEKAVKRNGKWVFKLTKDNGKSLFAAYNPYIHTSTTMLNDQFSEAQNRPNLVVVEVEVPESELTSGYKAEKAKDAVGRLEWKAGIIQGQLTGTREVILSRWDKPVRIVPTEEVAKSIAKQINCKVEVMPTNVVTPAQREALEKEGVKFVETDNRGKIVDGPNKGKTYSSVYGKKAKNSGYSEGEAKAKPQSTRHKENIRKHVENLLNKLGTRNRTTVITSINGVRNKARREHIENMHKQGKKVYGWFENGRIYLYLPDIDSIYKAEQTIWHETVAHVGLRELLGADNYGKLLNRLWMQHKDGEMGDWVTRRMQVNGWSLHKAIDEWLAREAEKVVAERQERRTLWQKLAGWVGDILREIGYRTNPTITDVRYLFWLSENQLREGEPMSAIKRAAFLHRLERENRTAVLQRSTKRGSDMDAGYSEDIDDPMEYSEKAVYDERLNRVETVFTEAYQDSMIALKTAQNAIAHDKAIPDSQNAYMAENLMHGKNKNEQDLFNSMLRDPLIDTINKIMNRTGMNWGDVDRYVYTKSGLERNREFFVRDWLERERNKNIRKYEDLNPEEQDIFDHKAEVIETLFEDGDIETEEQKEKELAKALQEAHKEYIDSIEERLVALKQKNYLDLQTGDINFADYLAGLTNFILDNIDGAYNPSENDYSGFRAMYGDEDGKYDEDEIIAELMDTEDAIEAENVDTLWEQIQNCTRYGLERYRESGMRSDEQIDKIEQMFHWYVPMRGFKNDTGEDMYQYFTAKGKEKSYIGGLLKHAKGRGSEANYPISTIFAMTYKAISDCNQNLVNQKLYRLCQTNPNDLVVLSDTWAKLNEATGEFEEAYPDINDDMDEEEIRQAVVAFEEEMKELAKENKAIKIRGKEKFDYVPMDKKKKSEHVIEVRINGQQKRMIVVGNPRMAQALNGQLRFERGKNVFSKWNNAVKNFMASVFTSYSPTFALRNMFRDWTHFRTMLGVREGRGYAKRANKYYRQSLFKMVGLFRKYREGTLNMDNEMERDFKDFMDNGGITGFVQMQKIDDIQKQMEKLYKQQKDGKPVRLNNKVWEYTLGAIEALNEGIENNARFATFRASRHYAGRTKARAAYDAKEITVNFNKKGAGSKTAGFKSQNKVVEDAAKAFGVTSQILGEGRIFFNATVQAIATTFKNFQKADGSLNKGYIAKWAARYALPPFAFGLALPMINQALAAAFGGDDDDPYANLPEWTRRKNICIYIGNNNFITIPIGQELAAFLALGDMFAGLTYAPNLKPVDRSIDEEMVGIMNTFSPVDIDTKITKGGLMEDPVDELVGRTFSVLAPLVAVGQNLGWTGRPIYREDKFQNDQFTPEYQMVYSGTNPALVNASKLLHELGGGDDIVRGKLEVNPAIVQYLWEQYSGGPGKFLGNTLVGAGKDLKDLLVEGEAPDFNIRKIEGVKAFVQQGDDRTQYYRTQAKYRKYKADAEKLHDAVKGYEGAAAEDPMALMKLENIVTGEDYVRMEIVREADKQLSKINKAANKAEGRERKELRRLYNEQVKAVVDLLDGVGKD